MATEVGINAVVLYGLSSDTKPSSPLGSLFIETDTGLEFSINEASTWVPRTTVLQTSDDTNATAVIVKDSVVIWASVDATGAPVLDYVAIGFASGGIATGKVYVNDPNTNIWRDTTQIVSGFFGV